MPHTHIQDNTYVAVIYSFSESLVCIRHGYCS